MSTWPVDMLMVRAISKKVYFIYYTTINICHQLIVEMLGIPPEPKLARVVTINKTLNLHALTNYRRKFVFMLYANYIWKTNFQNIGDILYILSLIRRRLG